MDNTRNEILENYQLMIIHYFKRGIGATSGLFNSKTIITPEMVINCLKRYVELNGSNDFSNVSDDKYEAWLLEMNG